MSGVTRSWIAPLTVLASGGLDVATDDTLPATYFDGLASDLLMLAEAIRNPGGRLTLTTATPVTTGDVTTASTLYYTPYQHDYVALYDGSAAWKLYHFSEISLDLDTAKSGAALDANLPHDIFLYDNSGTLTLQALAWTNTTTRATGLVLQDGVYVKSGATAYRYLGTICTTAVAGDTEDSEDRRFVWNAYHRVRRFLESHDTTNSWSYTTATWRAANASTTVGTARVELVIGLSEDLVQAEYSIAIENSNATGAVAAAGIGVDVTNSNSAQVVAAARAIPNTYIPVRAAYRGYPGIGYHYVQALEISEATAATTWYGDNNISYLQSGMLVDVLA